MKITPEYMFEVHQPYTLSEPYGANINSLEMAWQKCADDRHCVGFTREHKDSYKLNKNRKLHKVVSSGLNCESSQYIVRDQNCNKRIHVENSEGYQHDKLFAMI